MSQQGVDTTFRFLNLLQRVELLLCSNATTRDLVSGCGIHIRLLSMALMADFNDSWELGDGWVRLRACPSNEFAS